MGANRYLYMMWLVGAVLMAMLFAKTGEWLLGYVVAKPSEALITTGSIALAGVVAFVLWRNERILELATEVTTELGKVTWPNRIETRTATVVVIVTVIVFAIILGFYDTFWSWLTTKIYS